MLRPLHGDVSCAARALLAVPRARRAAVFREMIAAAAVADRHRAATRHPHPSLGNGSLMAIARKGKLPPEPFFDDPDYCHCFETVMRELRQHYLSRRHRPRRPSLSG